MSDERPDRVVSVRIERWPENWRYVIDWPNAGQDKGTRPSYMDAVDAVKDLLAGSGRER